MFDRDKNTYYLSGKVGINGANHSTYSSVVWIKLDDYEKITRIEAAFGSNDDRTALLGNSGKQNENLFMWLTDATPDEAVLED